MKVTAATAKYVTVRDITNPESPSVRVAKTSLSPAHVSPARTPGSGAMPPRAPAPFASGGGSAEDAAVIQRQRSKIREHEDRIIELERKVEALVIHIATTRTGERSSSSVNVDDF